ncbi:MAG: hypothetical protein J6N21_21845 [Butyrivibrio sp.]|nr:hypothetical protein [Butyrivibrio sp.]
MNKSTKITQQTMETQKRNPLSKFAMILSGILGIVTLIISLGYETFAPKDSNDMNGLFLLAIAYFFILLTIGFYANPISSKSDDWKSISLFSFYFYSLFIPAVIIAVIYGFLQKHVPNAVILTIGWVIQCVFVGIWFFPKLKRNKTKEKDLMRLDYYSTIAILVLTIIWVIYDILNIKLGFAITMGEFLIIQIYVKKSLIELKQDDE